MWGLHVCPLGGDLVCVCPSGLGEHFQVRPSSLSVKTVNVTHHKAYDYAQTEHIFRNHT